LGGKGERKGKGTFCSFWNEEGIGHVEKECLFPPLQQPILGGKREGGQGRGGRAKEKRRSQFHVHPYSGRKRKRPFRDYGTERKG